MYGARQTGKSTLIRELLPEERLEVDSADPAVRSRYLVEPETLIRECRKLPNRREDLLHQLRQLIPEGQSCERLVNQALRDWLAAKGMKELIRAEIHEAVHQTLSSQIRRESPE